MWMLLYDLARKKEEQSTHHAISNYHQLAIQLRSSLYLCSLLLYRRNNVMRSSICTLTRFVWTANWRIVLIVPLVVMILVTSVQLVFILINRNDSVAIATTLKEQ